MTYFYRVSLAVIAIAFFGAPWASGAPIITSQPRDQYGNTATILSVHENCALYLKIEATGTGPLTYQWKKGTTVVNAAGRGPTDQAELNLIPSFLTDAGDYTCVVTDSTGNITSNTIKVAAVDIRPRGVLSVTGQATATLKVDAAGTGLQYKWYRYTDAGGNVVNTKLLTSQAAKFTGISTNTLSVKNVTPNEVGQYFCRIFFQGFSMDGGYQHLAVVPTPDSHSGAVGDSVVFQVSPQGVANFDSLSYQWNGPVALSQPSATTNALALDNISLSDAGNYTCSVSGVFHGNAVAAATTAPAQLFVVNTAATKVISAAGKSPTLTFSPSGSSSTHTYQWYSKVGAVETALTNGADYAGADTAVLTVKNADGADAIDYFCRVTAYGDTDDTGLCRLIVVPAPDSTTVAAGETAELTVDPQGADAGDLAAMTFQWKRGATVLGTQTAQTLSIPNATSADAGEYTCIVTLAGVGSVTSPGGKIAVVDSAATRKLALAGSSPILGITASTDPAQTYQWYKVGSGGPDVLLVNGLDYSGATTKSLTVKKADAADAGDYYCKVTSYGVTANSGIRTLVVIPVPNSRTVLSGAPLQLQVVPAGAPVGDFSFQWKKGASAIGGANADTYLIPSASLTDAGTYSCVVTMTAEGVTVTTGLVKTVVVDSGSFIRLAKTDTGPTLPLTVAGLGATYQWYRVVDGSPDEALSNDGHFSGVLTKTLTVKNATVADAGLYRCEVTAFGETVTTALQRLVLIPPPDSQLNQATSTASLVVVPAGLDPALLSTVTYQWKKLATTLAGETDDTLEIPNVQLSNNGGYSCIVTLPGATPSSITSGTGKLNVVNNVGVEKVVLQGANPTFDVAVGGTGQTYQWFSRSGSGDVALSDGADYGGTTGKTLTIKNADLADGGLYVCKVSVYGQDVYGGENRLVVISPPQSMLVDAGSDLHLEVLVAGQAASVSYQWYKGTAALSGETGSELSITGIQVSHTGDYKCAVTVDGLTAVKTPTIKVSVVDHSSSSVVAVAGKDAKLTLSIGGTGQVFKWYRLDTPSVILANGADYSGATTKTITIKATDAADAGEYVCEVTAYGRMVAIGQRTLEVVQSPASTLVAVGSPLILEAASTGAITPLSYQWKKVVTAISGATDATLNIPSAVLKDSGNYACVVGAAGAASVTTNPAAVAVADLSAKSVDVDITKTATLAAVTSGLKITYQWHRRNGGDTPLSDGAKYTGTSTAKMSLLNAAVADAGDYVCYITANGVTLTTDPVTVFVHEAPEFASVSLPVGIVGGSYNYAVPMNPDPLKAATGFTATGLPAGLTIDKTTGVISGKPTATASATNVNITASNSAGSHMTTVPITINALPTYLAGDYTGPLPRNAALNSGLGGALQMTVAGNGGVSGKLYLGKDSRSFTGALDVQGTNSATATATASITVARTGMTPLTMTFDVGTNNLLVNGVVTDGTDTFNFHGWRNKFSAGSPASAYAGLHNFGMGLPSGDPNVGVAAVPQGVGFGSFTVANDGKLSISGYMADGTALTYATFIGPNGEMVIYKTLYTTSEKGSLLAELDIDDKGNGSPNDNSLSGTGTWNRPADPSATQRVYKAGFAPVNLAFEGGVYVPPTLVLGVTSALNNAMLSFEDGGLAAASRNPNVNVSIQTGNVVTIGTPNPGLTKFATTSTPTVMTNTGDFKGDFTLNDDDPTQGGFNPYDRKCTFVGKIYPKGGILVGAGYVIIDQLPTTSPPTTKTTSPKLSGAVFFERK